MRIAVVLTCLLAGAVAVYPEAPITGARRTTEMPRASSSISEASLLSEQDLEKWVANWQKRLGLEEWKIQTKIVRLNHLPKGTVANIHWSLPRRTATIKVLDPVDSTLSGPAFIRDTELSIVHELVHLSMAKLPLDSTDTELEEEAVKKISKALLALDKRDD